MNLLTKIILILAVSLLAVNCEDKLETPGDFAGGYFRFNDKKSCKFYNKNLCLIQ